MALPHGVMRVILLCWVCDDCRKEREKQDVLSHAKCPRCNSNDKEATAYVGDNYNLRCKHCWCERTESNLTNSFFLASGQVASMIDIKLNRHSTRGHGSTTCN